MANTRHNPTLNEFKSGVVAQVMGVGVVMIGTCTGRYTEYGRFIENNLAYFYEVDFGGDVGIKTVDVDRLEVVNDDGRPIG